MQVNSSQLFILGTILLVININYINAWMFEYLVIIHASTTEQIKVKLGTRMDHDLLPKVNFQLPRSQNHSQIQSYNNEATKPVLSEITGGITEISAVEQSPQLFRRGWARQRPHCHEIGCKSSDHYIIYLPGRSRWLVRVASDENNQF